MLGAEVPDLDTTPCAGCGGSLAETPPGELRWDPWQRVDPRLAALPYHAACAGPLLPPASLAEFLREDEGRCGRCQEPIARAPLEVAYAALQRRFLSALGSTAAPEVVWRLASREPRRYVAEHFACVLEAAVRRPPPELPGLGPASEGS